MAKNTKQGGRIGAVKNRVQTKTDAGYEKRDTRTGRVLGTKDTPYKGVRQK